MLARTRAERGRNSALILKKADWPLTKFGVERTSELKPYGAPMLMTPDEVKSAIADGTVSAITVDSNIFDESGPGFGVLPRLKQFAGTSVRFVLSEIVIREVMSHAAEGAGKALGELRKALKGVGRSWDISREKREEYAQTITRGESAEQVARRRFDGFVKETAAIQVAHNDVDLCKVVDDYFEKNAPFGAGDKKSEFPDAIALRALEIWASQQKTLVLVVSKDGDWERYCSESRNLVLVKDIGDALSYFHAEYEGLAKDVARRMKTGEIDWEDHIKSQVSYAIEGLGFVADAPAAHYFYDSDVWSVEVVSVSLQHSQDDEIVLKPIERGENLLIAQVSAIVAVGLRATFTFSTSDSEGDHIPMGSADAHSEALIPAELILTIADPQGETQIEDVDVEVAKQDRWVEFDDVEGPDWSED